MRGILAELSIYKRVYQKAGYSHAPTAAGYDFTGSVWVQIKSLKNPDGAVEAMKKAILKLRDSSPTAAPIKLHILKKPGSGSDQLENSLLNYVSGLGEQVSSRFTLEIQPFDLVP